MGTLKEAFKLCGVDDREVVYFSDRKEDAGIWSWPMTGQEVRQKYDMQNTMVVAIVPRFCVGEFDGFTFIIDRGQLIR